jgi:uncharacterized protein YciI
MSQPLEPGFVQIIHPETGGIAEVHRDGLQQYYASGWTLLTADMAPPAEPEPEPPAPMSEGQVAKGRAAKAKAAEDKAPDEGTKE